MARVLAGVGAAFGGVAIGLGVATGVGVGCPAPLTAGVFGVSVGLTAVFVFAGTGMRITPPSGGINWL